jgi:hypothetical protein
LLLEIRRRGAVAVVRAARSSAFVARGTLNHGKIVMSMLIYQLKGVEAALAGKPQTAVRDERVRAIRRLRPIAPLRT